MSDVVAERKSARERILDTAQELFCAKGFSNVGVDEVVEASGVAKMTLYKHFESKDLLAAEVLRRRSASFAGWFAGRVRELGATPAARLLACFDALHEWVAMPNFRGCPFLNAASELARRDHPAFAVVIEHKKQMLAMLTGMCAQAGAERPEALARQLMLLLDGAASEANVWKSPEPARVAKEAARALMDHCEA
jgi:AcrR family transcriptional regulator